MTFNSQTIAQTIPDINDSVFLPAIQREFVWDKKQIERLFDSITRGYPIGSLLFWNIRGDLVDKQVKYKFITDYIDGEIHPTSLHGRHHNEQLNEDFCDIPSKVTMVLDGQQRLTALNVGLNGSLTDRRSGTHRDLEKNWRRKKLYLNLLHDPESSDSKTVSQKFDYSFKQPNPPQTSNNYWYPVENILDAEDKYGEKERILEKICEDVGMEKDDIPTQTVGRNIEKLYSAIHEENYITYYKVDNSSEDEVLDIFVRANQGGTELSKPDMVLSIATSNWTNAQPEISARDKIRDYISELNEKDVRGSKRFDVRFVLTCLLAADDSSLSFSYKNFNNSTKMERLKQIWMEDKFKKSVNKTLELIDSFGLSLSNIGSPNSIIPIFYYLYNNPNAPIDWTTKTGKENRKKILYWLCSTIISGVYESKVPQILTYMNKAIKNSECETFPVRELSQSIRSFNVNMRMEKEMLIDNINGMNNRNQRYKLYLSLLYYPITANTIKQSEVDHIFPSAMLDEEKLVEKYGIDMSKAKKIAENSDRIGNLQIINGSTNRAKSNIPVDKWLSETSEEYKEEHFIPKDVDISVDNYLQFINKREEIIVKHISNKFGQSM